MNGKAEFSTLIGIFLGIFLVLLAIMSGTANPASFIDMPSVLIVLGGTFFITTASFSLIDCFKAFGVIIETLFFMPSEVKASAESCIKLAEIGRKEGLLALQKHKKEYPDNSFFVRSLNLAIDGIKPEQVEKIMIEEISFIASRRAKTIDILRKAAEIAPAMGLVGTLIGLVQMLGNLSDPTKIGPAMAVALLTTLYGAILSYMILQPLATKLERNSSIESDLLALYAEGVNSIARNEGPYILEMKFNAILPAENRLTKYSG